ncbi:MAG: CsgG/HfaB family protein [Thermodesulfovibrionales bacterium]
MKSILLILFILVFVSVSFSAAPAKPKATKESPASVEMKPADTKPSDVKPEEPKPAEETPKKVKRIDSYIAVFDLETTGKVDKDVIRPLTESIRREIVKSGKYEVIDRGNMDKILGEQKFQLSGCVSGQCIVEVGQLLGVGKIITGSVSMVGKTYYFSLQLVNVETGKIEDQSEDECKCEIDDLIKSSKRLVKKLMGETIPDQQVTTKALEKPAMPDIAGTWHWSVKSIFVPDRINTINADGTCNLSDGLLCTWSFQKDGKNIVFRFSDKWTHIMTLSKDGLSMSGSDDWGTGVTGTKIKGP